MARGETEKSCFEYIRHELFKEKALNQSYEEYCKDRIMLSKRPTECFYAMTEQDVERVEDVFLQRFPMMISVYFRILYLKWDSWSIFKLLHLI